MGTSSLVRRLLFVILAGGLFLSWAGPAAAAQQDLLVASPNSDQVKRYDGTTGAFVSDFAGGGALDGPIRMIFGPDGNLYVSSFFSSEVLRYHGVTGASMGAFVTAGSGGLFRGNGLTFGPDGNLYVVDWQLNGNTEILRYDGSTGAFMGVFTSGFNHLFGRDLLFAPAGLLVSLSPLNNVALHDPVSGSFINTFIPFGRVQGAGSLTLGPDGNLYVSSLIDSKVVRFNGATGAYIDDFVAAGSGGLNIPVQALFGPDGHLYVSSQNTDQILRYDGTTGAFLGVFVTAGSGGLDLPLGLAFMQTAFVPEPGSLALAAAGLGGAWAWRRGRRSRRQASRGLLFFILAGGLFLSWAGPAAAQSAFQYDDGVADYTVGFSGGGPVDFLWLNRFDTGLDAYSVTSISLAFGTPGNSTPAGLLDGLPLRALLWTDADGGDTRNAVLRRDLAGVVRGANTGTFAVYDIPDITVSGVIMIGVLVPGIPALGPRYIAPLDDDAPVSGVGFMGFAGAYPPADPSNLFSYRFYGPNADMLLLDAVWLVRADGVIVGVPEPASFALAAAGLGGAWVLRRRRSRRRPAAQQR